ncbi:MAG TPA: hypothetical protein DEA96_04465 [Leptospiraceae bacterium]|nr:hypothetical protein [Spirochaetaceae bacterium]HBS04195.1 hypothetical protein [Leptospiraceae bacterium]
MLRFFLSRPIASLMVTGFLLLVGLLGLSRLRVSLFPDLEVPRIYLLTRFPGMAPAQVEQMVTIPLEETIGSVTGLETMESRSERGLSVIETTFNWDTDRDLAMIELRQKLDQIYTAMPESASRTIMVPYDPSKEPIVLLHVVDKGLGKRLRFFLDTVLRPDLEQIDGVAALEINGGFERQITVNLDRPRLYGYGLDIQAVVEAIRGNNISEPVGMVRSGHFEKTVRIDARAHTLTDLEKIAIGKGENGATVLLSEVAEIEDSYADRYGETLINGEPGIVLGLRKEPGANTLDTSAAILEEIAKINKKHGQHVALNVIEDQSSFVRESIDSVQSAAILGAIIAFLLLLVFLSSFRTAGIVAATMPVAILISFGVLYLLDISLNVMSLSGLALGIGMLIDGSIMVSESIDRLISSEGHGSDSLSESSSSPAYIDKVLIGTRRVIGSLFASTLTTVVVFFPIIFVSGIAAALFRDLAISVVTSLLAGLFCSAILIPVLTLLSLRKDCAKATNTKKSPLRPISDALQRVGEHFQKFLVQAETRYASSMQWALNHPRHIGSFVTFSAVLGIASLFFLPRGIMPDSGADAVNAEVTLPEGTSFKDTARFAATIDRAVRQAGIANKSIVSIGYENDDPSEQVLGKKPQNSASFTFFLAPGISSSDALRTVKDLLPAEHPVPIEAVRRPGPIQRIIGEGQNEYEIELQGFSDNAGAITLRKMAEVLPGITGVLSVRKSNLHREPLIDVTFDRELVAQSGVSPAQLASHLRSSIDGMSASVFREGDRSIDVKVRLQEAFRKNPGDLTEIKMSTQDGQQVNLDGLIRTKSEQDDPALLRSNQRRVHRLRFRTSEVSLDETLGKVSEQLQSLMPTKQGANPSGSTDGTFSVQPVNAKTVDSLKSLIFAFAFSCVLIYQLLAGQFESLLHPLALLLSIPSLLFGAGLALFVGQAGLSISSGIGIIMLSGIVINASIALFEGIQIRRSERDVADRLGLIDCIIEAGRSRIRPILLTTFTTIGGILPLAIGIGSGSENQQPMGIAMVGGLLVGTAVALVAFPCFYYLIERRKFR